MKKLILLPFLALLGTFSFASSNVVDEYTADVYFPAGYAVGDYVEFLKVLPYDAGASGYYDISITYVRGNIAAAATHRAAILLQKIEELTLYLIEEQKERKKLEETVKELKQLYGGLPGIQKSGGK